MKKIDAALLASAARPLARTSFFDLVKRLPMARAPGRPDKSWYSIAAAASDEVDILIYDEIGMWGISATQFVKDLAEVTAKVINLRINSPGGSVFDGIAIYNSLVQHKAKVIVHIDGWAASIASVIAMCGDEIRISEVAQIMIHRPWSFVIGFADDMRKEADVLDGLQGAIIDVYEARTRGDRDEITNWVREETWFKGQQAVDAGFADKIVPLKVADPPEDKAKPAARLPVEFFDGIFQNLPADVRSALEARRPPAAAISTERQFQDFLRECGGFTRARANAIATKGFKADADPRDEAASDQRSETQQERRDGAAPPRTPTASDRRDDAGKRAEQVAQIKSAAISLPRI